MDSYGQEHMVVDVRLKSPFTAMIVGPTGSGKTVEVMRLINNSALIATPPPKEIIYCYGVWQKAFEELPMTNITFHEGLIDIKNEIKRDGNNRWLIIDDLMEETAGKTETNAIYTKYSHHLDISVIFIAQSFFRKEQRIMSLNSHYFFLFKNPRDSAFVSHLGQQAFRKKSAYLEEAYKDATTKPFSYLLIDLKQQTDERVRLIGGFNSANMIAYAPIA